MSQENVEVLRRIYEGWAKGDFRSSADNAVYDPDLVWVLSDEFPNPGEHRGLAAASEGFREWLRAWSHWRIAAEEFLERGDQVVVLTHFHGRGRDSDLLIDGRGADVWTFRDGRVVRQEVWLDRDEALEAVGLSE
jgi:ketosteroid isomerase-like protein